MPKLVREAEAGKAIALTRRGERVAVLIVQKKYEHLVMKSRGFSEACADFIRITRLEELGIDPDEEPLRPVPRVAALQRLRRHEDEIAISSIVWHELRFGLERLPESRRREVIERYLEDVVLATMPILDYDRAAAEWHATERTRLGARRETPRFADGQIAAIAATGDLTVVTFNTTDFKRFRGIRVQT